VSSFLENLLEEELKIVNKHLPRERVSLCEALERNPPEVALRDGSRHRFDERELKELKELMGERACELYLPIIVYYYYGLERGVYAVKGDAETLAVSKMLGREGTGEKGNLYISRAEFMLIRSRFRTTTSLAFVPARGQP